MRHHFFIRSSDPAAVHAVMESLAAHVADYEFLVMNDSEWTACRGRFRHEDAPDELEQLGIVTWDSIADHTAFLEDHHHVGIVHADAGIVTGDSTIVAARKLYEHIGRYRPFRPVMI